MALTLHSNRPSPVTFALGGGDAVTILPGDTVVDIGFRREGLLWRALQTQAVLSWVSLGVFAVSSAELLANAGSTTVSAGEARTEATQEAVAGSTLVAPGNASVSASQQALAGSTTTTVGIAIATPNI